VGVVPGEVVWSRVASRDGRYQGLPRQTYEDVVLCDAFDNATQELVEWYMYGGGSQRLVAAWAQDSLALLPFAPMPESEVALEFAAGPWGTWSVPGDVPGAALFRQSRARCADTLPINRAGWVDVADVDFGNTGARLLNASDVNVVRARFVEPVRPGDSRALVSFLRVRDRPAGTILTNYGSGFASTDAAQYWLVGSCWDESDSTCPEPPRVDLLGRLGLLGRALIVVDAATRLYTYSEPDIRQETVTNAGEVVRLTNAVEVVVPQGVDSIVVAADVVVTTVLPVGLTFVPGTAIRRSEDVNGNGQLDPGEDLNLNGVLDGDMPASPTVQVDVPGPGATTLTWRLGTLAGQWGAQRARVSYDARVGQYVRGGTVLVVRTEVRSRTEPADPCSFDPYKRCQSVSVTVANVALAGVEKIAVRETIAVDEPARFRLIAANLTSESVEWLDAVDILPWEGDPREPASHRTAPWRSITTTVVSSVAPVQVWASPADPAALDQRDGGTMDGVVDPVAAYGGPGAGLGGPDWPCLLGDVGTPACGDISAFGDVTALRLWGPDPDPADGGRPESSFMPPDSGPAIIDVWLHPERGVPGAVMHNAWGGRLEGLELPAFDGAIARIAVPPLYLPYAAKQACKPRPASLAIAIDASTSMQRPSGTGGSKMDAVVAAATQLAEVLASDALDHEVAVVGFNSRAWTALALTDDAVAVGRALESLSSQMAHGTRLDLGITEASAALAGAHAGRHVVVFLTDGLPNGVPLGPGGTQEETVLAAADAAHAQRVVIHTIGYGRPDAADPADRVSPALLGAISGAEGSSWIVPDATGLSEVFAAIAEDVLCPR
jgi:hypothetical protein